MKSLYAGAALIALIQPGIVFAQTTGGQEPAEEMATPAADAPEAEQSEDEGNAIVVTALKREQTLQDTPVAVSVTTAEAIERAQIRDLKDLQSLVPSLRVTQSQSQYATTYNIRGFGTSGNNVGLEPSVAVFVDGVYRSRAFAQVGDFPDLQRVEVLRGPQSSLFGKNASAGVISIVTRKPSFNFGGNVEASYGNYDAMVVKGYVTGPIGETLAASLAGGYNRRDGFTRDLATGSQVDDRNRWFLRGQLLFEPTSNLTIRLIGDYDKIDEVCCSAFNLRAARPGPTSVIEALGGRVNNSATMFDNVVYNSVDPTSQIRNWGISGQIDYELGPLTLTSITALRDSMSRAEQDTDFTSADLARGANVGAVDQRTFTQELRIGTDLEGPFNFLLGAYYFNETLESRDQIVYGRDFRNYVNALIQAQSGGLLSVAALEALTSAPSGTYFAQGQGLFNVFEQDNEAWSAFGSVDIALADRLTVTLGGSYTHDAKDVTSTSVSTDRFSAITLPTSGPLASLRSLQFLPPFLNIPNAVESGQTRDGDWSWTARLALEATDTVNLYAAWSTGFKASSFNLSRDSRPLASDIAAIRTAGFAPANLTSGSRFARPENSELFEVGLKGNWGLASANLTVFKQSIDDFQTNLFTGTGFALGNADKQSTFGIEFDGRVNPTDALTLTMAMTYLDPKYDSYVASPFGDVSGTRIVTIPQLSATWGFSYDQELASGDSVILRADYHYESPVQVLEGLPGFITRSGSTVNYQTGIDAARPFRREVNDVNASLTYAMANGLDLTVWGRNLLNDRDVTGIFDSVAQSGSISGYLNQPRTYGVSARFKW